MDYYFFCFYSQGSTFNLEKKTKALVKENLLNNQIYLLWNCFSNVFQTIYDYLKDMYITLKGIEKSLFVLMLQILLMSAFLKFTAVFIKKI